MEFSQRKPTCFLLSLGWEFSTEVHNMISKEWNAPPPTPQRMCQEIRLLYTKNSCMLWRVICLRIYSSQTASVSALHGWSLLSAWRCEGEADRASTEDRCSDAVERDVIIYSFMSSKKFLLKGGEWKGVRHFLLCAKQWQVLVGIFQKAPDKRIPGENFFVGTSGALRFRVTELCELSCCVLLRPSDME